MMNGGGDLSQQTLNHPKQHLQPNHQMHQQQWMAMHQYQQQMMAMQMQYPVMMNPNMVYGQQYMPAAYYQQHQIYQQQQHQQQPKLQQEVKQNFQIQNSGDENRTIWIGDLQQWMDEAYLQSCFVKAGEVLSVKVIRNKLTGQSERYGFIEFNTHAAADTVLQSYNATPMPNSEQPFRLNWAAFSLGNNKRVGADAVGSDLSIFVGDLAPDVTDTILQETFASRYPSVRGAKVVIDTNTGRSKGYGFVRFGDENERTRSMTEMNGAYCSSRPMRIGVATPKKPGAQQQYSSQGENGFW